MPRPIYLTVVSSFAFLATVSFFSSRSSAGWKEEAEAADIRADYATSLRIVEPLAVHGDADAQVNLGVRYQSGLGVAQDYGKAINWFRRAAEQGNSDGYGWLGIMYGMGQGVPKDSVEAAKWSLKAADAGLTFSQYLIAQRYALGQGVPTNYIEAYKWLHLAIDGEKDKENLKIFQTLHLMIIRKMTAEQISRAEFLMGEWKSKHVAR